MLAAIMSWIEAEATVPASPAAVWQALLDTDQWARWPAAAGSAPGRFTLELLESLAGPAAAVGALRRGSGTLGLPLLGGRTVSWVEQVSDVGAACVLELETLGISSGPWRLRLWLVEQLDGTTRVRCRLISRPAGLHRRLADALFLLRALERHTQATLTGLAQSFAPVVVEVESTLQDGPFEAVAEPVAVVEAEEDAVAA